jgi:predicted PurR-regulated permease PerM
VPRDIGTAIEHNAGHYGLGGAMPAIVAERVTRYEIAAWILTGGVLLLILGLHLLTALLGGLLVYELVHVMARRLRFGSLSSTGARMMAVAVLSGVIIAAVTGAVIGSVAFFRSETGGLTALMTKLAEILEHSRAYLPDSALSDFSSDAEMLREDLANWLREHAGPLESMGRALGRALLHLFIGMIIGALISLDEVRPDAALQPFSTALLERVHRLGDAFRRVVFAQIRVAAINAALTGIYLMVALPLFGVHLPFGKTLLLLTFVCGLIPVVGNLISNTVIVLVSLSQSLPIAASSLLFLVVIHKLEYFLNARIVGTQIHSRPWELLIAMLAMEAAFGAAGLVAAPIYYAYLKAELADRGLI